MILCNIQYFLQIVAFLCQSRKDVEKFGTTVAHRCVNDEFTLSALHVGMISGKSQSFSSHTILEKQQIKWSTLTEYAKHFEFDLKDMKTNWKLLGDHWPFVDGKSTGAVSHRLKTGHPSNKFFNYIVRALRCFPGHTLAAIRHGSEGMHLAGMFLAAYYAQGVTRAYFDVRQITEVMQDRN